MIHVCLCLTEQYTAFYCPEKEGNVFPGYKFRDVQEDILKFMKENAFKGCFVFFFLIEI